MIEIFELGAIEPVQVTLLGIYWEPTSSSGSNGSGGNGGSFICNYQPPTVGQLFP